MQTIPTSCVGYCWRHLIILEISIVYGFILRVLFSLKFLHFYATTFYTITVNFTPIVPLFQIFRYQNLDSFYSKHFVSANHLRDSIADLWPTNVHSRLKFIILKSEYEDVAFLDGITTEISVIHGLTDILSLRIWWRISFGENPLEESSAGHFFEIVRFVLVFRRIIELRRVYWWLASQHKPSQSNLVK